MGSVCVEIAVRDDPRLLSSLASLRAQHRRPDHVLVAASTASPDALLESALRENASLPMEIVRFAGGVVEARAASLARIREDVTVFLDSDEQAPPDWLQEIVEPIEQGTADFTGGPTRPARTPEGPIERYAVLLEASIYADLVPSRITYLPLQNTAWNTRVLRQLGFDPRIPFAEDHDLETRAAAAGFRGMYVPAAVVEHDPSAGSSYAGWARKRYRYLVAMAMSLLKNGELRERVRERRKAVRHPLRYVEAAMKPLALADAALRWRKVREADLRVPPPTDR